MRIISNERAVSTFILIILLLCSAVFGALISYMLVMMNYYNMPENTTLLIVEDVVFPISDVTYFNVTILNPSNSASDTNITAIRLSVEGKNEIYNVTATEPERLPFLMRRGTRQTFRCEENWSNFAGETVRIEPIAENTSTKSYSYTTPKIKLILTPTFDFSQSVEYFGLTIENSAESVIDLEISKIMVLGMSINENVTPSLPHVLSPNRKKLFQCNWNWENLIGQNVTITVETTEGYKSIYATGEVSGANLYIKEEPTFDHTDVTYFNVTISSSEDSTTLATIIAINLTLQDGKTIPINHTNPPLGSISGWIEKNDSKTFSCTWNWKEYRNKTITVNAYTKEGITISNKTVKTPPAVIWNVTNVESNLDFTNHFLVNVTNMPCSLHEINVTKIMLMENLTVTDPPFAVLSSGEQKMFNCTLDWKDYIGETVTITVFIESGSNISTLAEIPAVKLKLPEKPVTGELLVPYINITISNSNNSLQNLTITKILCETINGTYEIDGALTDPKLAPDGYVLKVGEEVTVVCPWNWHLYLGESLTVTVYTAEGFQTSRTWHFP